MFGRWLDETFSLSTLRTRIVSADTPAISSERVFSLRLLTFIWPQQSFPFVVKPRPPIFLLNEAEICIFITLLSHFNWPMRSKRRLGTKVWHSCTLVTLYIHKYAPILPRLHLHDEACFSSAIRCLRPLCRCRWCTGSDSAAVRISYDNLLLIVKSWLQSLSSMIFNPLQRMVSRLRYFWLLLDITPPTGWA